MKERFCYTTMETSQRVFADEVHKQEFLRLLETEAGEWKYEVAAFIILDDEVQLLLCKNAPSAKNGGGRKMIEELSDAYLGYYGRSSGQDTAMVREHISWAEVEPSDALNRCCEIHMAAMKRGCADRITDWWWSSFQTFRGTYYWRFLQIRNILRLFGATGVSARTQFLRYQRKKLKEENRKDD